MNEKINLPELTALLSEKAGITKKEAETFLREFFGLMTESLINDDPVKVKDLGTFKQTKVEDRESVNVRTGERVLIPAHQKISFSASGQLSETVNEPFALFEPVELKTTYSEKDQDVIATELADDIDDTEIDDDESVHTIAELLNTKEESKLIIGHPKAMLPITDNIINKDPEVLGIESEQESVVPEIATTNTTEINTEPEAPVKKKKCSGWIACLLIFIFLLLLAAGIMAYLWHTNPQFKSAAKSLIDTTISSFNRNKAPVVEKTISMNETKPVENKVDSTTVAPPVSHENPDSIKTDKSATESAQPEKKEPLPESKIYTLQDGQRLTLIALREYGHKAFWIYIYEENKNNLESPHLIPIGTKLRIPPAKKYDIDKNNPESINKAKALAKKYE